MLNSGKKFTLRATKKINILTLVLSDKKTYPPSFKLNGRSLMSTQDPLVLVVLIWMY